MRSVDLNGKAGFIYKEINNLREESLWGHLLSITSTYVVMAYNYIWALLCKHMFYYWQRSTILIWFHICSATVPLINRMQATNTGQASKFQHSPFRVQSPCRAFQQQAEVAQLGKHYTEALKFPGSIAGFGSRRLHLFSRRQPQGINKVRSKSVTDDDVGGASAHSW